MEKEKVLCEIEKCNQEIFDLRHRISELEKKIKEHKKNLWLVCNHEWGRGYDVPFDDRIKYKCSHCNLWRRASLYL